MRGVLSFVSEDPQEAALARSWFRRWFARVTAIKETDLDGVIHIYVVEAPPDAIAAIPSRICGARARYESAVLAPPKKNPFPISARERQSRNRRHQ